MISVWLSLILLFSVSFQAHAQKNVQYLKELSSAFVNVAKEITPAVVSIEATKKISVDSRFNPGFFDERFRRLFPDQEIPSVGLGSGVIFDKDGYILTNNHVVEDAEGLIVRLNDKRQFEGKLIGADPLTDVAVIKIDGKNLPYAKLGDSDNVQVGEWVLAVGTPFEERLNTTVTAGIVSAVGRSLGIINQTYNYRIENFIQTDAAINPGNSGGPLVNLDGEVIGINSAIYSSSGKYQGYGFSIPINLVRNIADDLRRYGKVVRGIIGVSIRNIGDKFLDPNDPNSRVPVQELMTSLSRLTTRR